MVNPVNPFKAPNRTSAPSEPRADISVEQLVDYISEFRLSVPVYLLRRLERLSPEQRNDLWDVLDRIAKFLVAHECAIDEDYPELSLGSWMDQPHPDPKGFCWLIFCAIFASCKNQDNSAEIQGILHDVCRLRQEAVLSVWDADVHRFFLVFQPETASAHQDAAKRTLVEWNVNAKLEYFYKEPNIRLAQPHPLKALCMKFIQDGGNADGKDELARLVETQWNLRDLAQAHPIENPLSLPRQLEAIKAVDLLFEHRPHGNSGRSLVDLAASAICGPRGPGAPPMRDFAGAIATLLSFGILTRLEGADIFQRLAASANLTDPRHEPEYPPCLQIRKLVEAGVEPLGPDGEPIGALDGNPSPSARYVKTTLDMLKSNPEFFEHLENLTHEHRSFHILPQDTGLIHRAVKRKDVVVVEGLLRLYPDLDLDRLNFDGRSLLTEAIHNHSLDIALALVHAGAAVRPKDARDLLRLAAEDGRPDVVRTLAAGGALISRLDMLELANVAHVHGRTETARWLRERIELDRRLRECRIPVPERVVLVPEDLQRHLMLALSDVELFLKDRQRPRPAEFVNEVLGRMTMLIQSGAVDVWEINPEGLFAGVTGERARDFATAWKERLARLVLSERLKFYGRGVDIDAWAAAATDGSFGPDRLFEVNQALAFIHAAYSYETNLPRAAAWAICHGYRPLVDAVETLFRRKVLAPDDATGMLASLALTRFDALGTDWVKNYVVCQRIKKLADCGAQPCAMDGISPGSYEHLAEEHVPYNVRYVLRSIELSRTGEEFFHRLDELTRVEPGSVSVNGASYFSDPENPEGDTVLHQACRKNDTVVIRGLLHLDSTMNVPNNKGQMPLHLANGGEAIGLLLTHGVNRRGYGTTGPDALRHRDADGLTPLDRAAQRGDLEGMLLLSQAVDRGDPRRPQELLKARDGNGQTMLHRAVRSGFLENVMVVLAEMVRHRVDPNQADREGFTALARAVESGNMDAVQALLGAKAQLRDEDVHALVRIADRTQRADIVRMLVNAGVRISGDDALKLLAVAQAKGDRDMESRLGRMIDPSRQLIGNDPRPAGHPSLEGRPSASQLPRGS